MEMGTQSPALSATGQFYFCRFGQMPLLFGGRRDYRRSGHSTLPLKRRNLLIRIVVGEMGYPDAEVAYFSGIFRLLAVASG